MSTKTFQSAFVNSFSVPSSGLEKTRLGFWQKFLEVGIPERKSEVFQYIKLQSLYETPFQRQEREQPIDITPFVLPECDGRIVFVNGRFRADLSDVSLIKGSLLSLSEAVKSYGMYLNNTFSKMLKEECDPFALLNGACFQEGAFMYIAPQSRASIQILSIVDGAAEQDGIHSWMMPRLQLFVGNRAEVSIAKTYHVSNSERYFYNEYTEIAIEEEAKMQCTIFDTIPSHAWQFEAYRLSLQRSSRSVVNTFTASWMSRRDWRVALAGEGAEALLSGIAILENNQEAHTHVVMEHLQPNCQSNQLFKNVVADTARSSFQGTIFVDQKAQKTAAYQLNNNLLLSDYAEANSKPNLQIYADDVKASHGATSGQIDPEELFYLKSRGISEPEAKNCLIHGFCEEIISNISFESLGAAARSSINTFLGSHE